MSNAARKSNVKQAKFQPKLAQIVIPHCTYGIGLRQQFTYHCCMTHQTVPRKQTHD